MKTIPPPCPIPESGPKYWRSLDQVAETPEFQQWLQNEFPAGASEFTDGTSRRHFVKIMSASFLLGGLGLTGCRKPVENILPFSKQPENYIHGKAKFFATSRPTRGSSVPLLVKSHEGRPVKVESNPEHPAGNAGTDHFTQASILNLFDPDRAMAMSSGDSVKTIDFLTQAAKRHAATGGEGLVFLLERSSSPSRLRVQQLISAKYPKARWFLYEPIDLSAGQQAASTAFGQSIAPQYQLDKAKRIFALDCDFLGAEEDSYRFIRGFAKGRKQKTAADEINRLYAVEAVFSITGANADHRLRLPASQVLPLAAKLAVEVLKEKGGAGELGAALDALAGEFKGDEKWVTEAAKDLAHSSGESVVLAGHSQPAAVHFIAAAINNALGSVGKVVVLNPAPEVKTGSLADLVAALNAGTVDTLVSLGGNPVYAAPVDLDFAAAQKKAKSIIRWGYYHDESAEGASYFIPAAHYLESWGDGRTSDGTYVSVQPLIEPLFGGFTELEVLAHLGGLDAVRPHDIVRETFAGIVKPANLEEAWKKFIHDGFAAGTAPAPVAGKLNVGAIAAALKSATVLPTPSAEKLEVVFHRDYSVDDGRYNNNGWLQETPNPITKVVWENIIAVSPNTAKALNLKAAAGRKNADPEKENAAFKSNDEGTSYEFSDVIELELGGRKVTGTIWIQPGLADNTVAIALGYGRPKPGRVGYKVGFNAYALRTSTAPYFAAGGKLTNTGKTARVVSTQEHGAMDGRPIIREANLDQYRKKTDFANNMDLEAHSEFIPKDKKGEPKNIYQHPYVKNPETKSDVHQWGMVVDLSSCVGCTACVTACQSENNVPIVGRDQVNKGREMHWMRIDRYFTGDAANPQSVNQPMMCQHCESAPCESVCPVNATVHDEEGVNVMAYNRCIGTRYCSNNCPFKVRRFNFFDFNKRPNDYAGMNGQSGNLYKGPFAKREPLEYDLIKLAKNPEVTVRMRGVMEKCTFCIQRIEGAKIAQKVKAGASPDVAVPDGTFTTACAQACPADAIAFGNILDPHSKVSQLKALDRNYAVLGFLDVKARTTYLARIRNPNPAMPDYEDLKMPMGMKEYSDKHGSPFEAHHASNEGHGHESAPAHAEKKGAH